MAAVDEISRLIRRYQQGAYTLRELLPLVVKHTPHERLVELKGALPGEIWTTFVKWIQDYPLDGGIQIRDHEDLSIQKIKWLKQHTQSEC